MNTLNPQQKLAVETTSGPILIIAGAGSGKTRVITHRIAYLIQNAGISPYNILAITFTNKAADEMRSRVLALLGADQRGFVENADLRGMDENQRRSKRLFQKNSPNMGTFHSVCAQILRLEAKSIGYKSTFTIYDESDQKAAIKKAMEKLNLDTKQYPPEAILHMISSAKNELISANDYGQYASSYFQEIVERVYIAYQKLLFDHQAMDFDDLIFKIIVLFKNHPEILEKYQEKFKYILIDEYQDTNKAQYEFVKMLSKKYQNICVVGDSDQSIYGWRGANFRNLLGFERDFPKSKTIKLEQNYRSTKNILAAANSLITKNTLRKEKNLWTENEEGEKIYYYNAEDGSVEADYVVRQIKGIMNNELRIMNEDRNQIPQSLNPSISESLKLNQFVILYRTNAQSRALEEAFLKYNLPYKIVGGVRFYERKEIKDMIAYLRVIYNPMDIVALERIINMPARGITAKTLQKILPIWTEFFRNFQIPNSNDQSNSKFQFSKLKDHIENISDLNTKAKSSTIRFIDILELFIKSIDKLNLAELIDFIAKGSGYKDFLLKPKGFEKEASIENEARWENILELKSVAEDFANMPTSDALAAFLEEVSLLSSIDQYNSESDAVSLMTAHNAKGLEFDYVFVVGLEENLFPHSKSMLEPAEMEEERRLFYVAVTRAKKRVFLTSAESRIYFGQLQMNSPSRFIYELPEELIYKDKEKLGFFVGSTKRADKKLKSAIIDLQPADQIVHKIFGEGVIIKIEGNIAEIAFADAGLKKIAVDIAPIRKINK